MNRSIDGGDTWQPVNTGLTSLTITALAIAPDGRLFAGTDRGIFRTAEPFSTADENPEKPTSSWLGQNFPNPFSTQTTIPINVEKLAPVSLIVYDVLGREVVRLIDGMSVQGVHHVEFDASWLPEGIYLYKLQTGSKINTGRMTVLR